MVGLVRDQDRSRVVARPRRVGLPRAAGVPRVYDLAERAIPPELRAQEWTDERCATRLVAAAGRSLGVATEADLAVYHGLSRQLVRRVLPDTALAPVAVEGWRQPAFADPAALESLGMRSRHRSLLLSPFDSLIWYRDRVERLFGLRHRLEAYTPKAKRAYGYFAMPVLAGTKIVGLVDPGRRDDALVAKQVTLLEPAACASVARALEEAASWVGCTEVVVERVDPGTACIELERHLNGPRSQS